MPVLISMFKIIEILFLILLFSACNRTENSFLQSAQKCVHHSPELCLTYLDSINDRTRLNLSQTYTYYYLKCHATFKNEGTLNHTILLQNSPAYWLQKKDLHKAAYSYLYNGIISTNLKLYEEAAICLNEAKEIALKQQDSLLLFYSYYYRGNIYLKTHDFLEGSKSYHKALNYYLLSDTLPHDLLKAAVCHWFTKQYPQADSCFHLFKEKAEKYHNLHSSAKMLYQFGKNYKNKKIRKKIYHYLQEYFAEDSLAQLYSNMVNLDRNLKKNRLDSAYRILNSLPFDKLKQDPLLLLQYYKLQGIFYLKTDQDRKVLGAFKNYTRLSDSIQYHALNARLNTIVKDYSRAKLVYEIDSLKSDRIIFLLILFTFILFSSLIIITFSISRKKKNDQLIENERLIETLQNLCTDQENQQNKFRTLLMSKLETSHKLVQIASQEIPKNISFLKMYQEIIGDLQPMELEWEELYQMIDCVYENFHKRLIGNFPELNEKEIQTCCLLRGGFKTDEIAFVMKQTIFSIHKRKTTIRKKLNLEDRSDIIEGIQNLFSSEAK